MGASAAGWVARIAKVHMLRYSIAMLLCCYAAMLYQFAPSLTKVSVLRAASVVTADPLAYNVEPPVAASVVASVA